MLAIIIDVKGKDKIEVDVLGKRKVVQATEDFVKLIKAELAESDEPIIIKFEEENNVIIESFEEYEE